jgi:hypothetical protein
MRVKDKYPIMFKELAKQFGARRSIKIIESLYDRVKINCDGTKLWQLFTFSGSPQGQKFWIKVSKKIKHCPKWILR